MQKSRITELRSIEGNPSCISLNTSEAHDTQSDKSSGKPVKPDQPVGRRSCGRATNSSEISCGRKSISSGRSCGRANISSGSFWENELAVRCDSDVADSHSYRSHRGDRPVVDAVNLFDRVVDGLNQQQEVSCRVRSEGKRDGTRAEQGGRDGFNVAQGVDDAGDAVCRFVRVKGEESDAENSGYDLCSVATMSEVSAGGEKETNGDQDDLQGKKSGGRTGAAYDILQSVGLWPKHRNMLEILPERDDGIVGEYMSLKSRGNIKNLSSYPESTLVTPMIDCGRRQSDCMPGYHQKYKPASLECAGYEALVRLGDARTTSGMYSDRGRVGDAGTIRARSRKSSRPKRLTDQRVKERAWSKSFGSCESTTELTATIPVVSSITPGLGSQAPPTGRENNGSIPTGLLRGSPHSELGPKRFNRKSLQSEERATNEVGRWNNSSCQEIEPVLCKATLKEEIKEIHFSPIKDETMEYVDNTMSQSFESKCKFKCCPKEETDTVHQCGCIQLVQCIEQNKSKDEKYGGSRAQSSARGGIEESDIRDLMKSSSCCDEKKTSEDKLKTDEESATYQIKKEDGTDAINIKQENIQEYELDHWCDLGPISQQLNPAGDVLDHKLDIEELQKSANYDYKMSSPEHDIKGLYESCKEQVARHTLTTSYFSGSPSAFHRPASVSSVLSHHARPHSHLTQQTYPTSTLGPAVYSDVDRPVKHSAMIPQPNFSHQPFSYPAVTSDYNRFYYPVTVNSPIESSFIAPQARARSISSFNHSPLVSSNDLHSSNLSHLTAISESPHSFFKRRGLNLGSPNQLATQYGINQYPYLFMMPGHLNCNQFQSPSSQHHPLMSTYQQRGEIDAADKYKSIEVTYETNTKCLGDQPPPGDATIESAKRNNSTTLVQDTVTAVETEATIRPATSERRPSNTLLRCISKQRVTKHDEDFIDPTRMKFGFDDDEDSEDNDLTRMASDEEWKPDKMQEEDGANSDTELDDDDVYKDGKEDNKNKCPNESGRKFRRKNITMAKTLETGLGMAAKEKKCQTCGKLCNGNYQLRRHEMSHSEYRPHRCPYCDKGFKQKAHLKGHTKSVHCKPEHRGSSKSRNNKRSDIAVPEADTARVNCSKVIPQSEQNGRKITKDEDRENISIETGVQVPITKKEIIENVAGKRRLGRTRIERPRRPVKDREFCCRVCGKEFKTAYRLKRHEQSHTDVRPYACRTCGKRFKQSGHRNEHEANHQRQGIRFLCNKCGVVFRCRSSFNSHMRAHGLEQTRQQQLAVETDKTRDNGKVGPQDKWEAWEMLSTAYDCPYCVEKFATAQALNNHLDTHVEITQRRHVQPYSCDVCRRTFTYRHNLLKHSLMHKAPEKFADFYKEKMEAHVASGKPSYKCFHCSKVFIRKETLAKHMKIHTGVKPFKCSTCSQSFTQNIHLKVHMRKHTGSRPFQCRECGKGFIDSTALAKHIEYEACNSENFVYHCKLCDKRHYYLGSIKQHLRREHGVDAAAIESHIERTERAAKGRKQSSTKDERLCRVDTSLGAGSERLQCLICSRTFKEKHNLLRHVRRKHIQLLTLLSGNTNPEGLDPSLQQNFASPAVNEVSDDGSSRAKKPDSVELIDSSTFENRNNFSGGHRNTGEANGTKVLTTIEDSKRKLYLSPISAQRFEHRQHVSSQVAYKECLETSLGSRITELKQHDEANLTVTYFDPKEVPQVETNIEPRFPENMNPQSDTHHSESINNSEIETGSENPTELLSPCVNFLYKIGLTVSTKGKRPTNVPTSPRAMNTPCKPAFDFTDGGFIQTEATFTEMGNDSKKHSDSESNRNCDSEQSSGYRTVPATETVSALELGVKQLFCESVYTGENFVVDLNKLDVSKSSSTETTDPRRHLQTTKPVREQGTKVTKLRDSYDSGHTASSKDLLQTPIGKGRQLSGKTFSENVFQRCSTLELDGWRGNHVAQVHCTEVCSPAPLDLSQTHLRKASPHFTVSTVTSSYQRRNLDEGEGPETCQTEVEPKNSSVTSSWGGSHLQQRKGGNLNKEDRDCKAKPRPSREPTSPTFSGADSDTSRTVSRKPKPAVEAWNAELPTGQKSPLTKQSEKPCLPPTRTSLNTETRSGVHANYHLARTPATDSRTRAPSPFERSSSHVSSTKSVCREASLDLSQSDVDGPLVIEETLPQYKETQNVSIVASTSNLLEAYKESLSKDDLPSDLEGRKTTEAVSSSKNCSCLEPEPVAQSSVTNYKAAEAVETAAPRSRPDSPSASFTFASREKVFTQADYDAKEPYENSKIFRPAQIRSSRVDFTAPDRSPASNDHMSSTYRPTIWIDSGLPRSCPLEPSTQGAGSGHNSLTDPKLKQLASLLDQDRPTLCDDQNKPIKELYTDSQQWLKPIGGFNNTITDRTQDTFTDDQKLLLQLRNFASIMKEKNPTDKAMNDKGRLNNAVNDKSLPHNAVNERSLSDNALNRRSLSDNSAKEKSLPDNAVNEKSLPDHAVNERSLPDNAVNEKSLPDHAVNERSLPDNTVNEKRLPDNAANVRSLPENAVNEKSLPDNAVNDKSLPDNEETGNPSELYDHVLQSPMTSSYQNTAQQPSQLERATPFSSLVSSSSLTYTAESADTTKFFPSKAPELAIRDGPIDLSTNTRLSSVPSVYSYPAAATPTPAYLLDFPALLGLTGTSLLDADSTARRRETDRNHLLCDSFSVPYNDQRTTNINMGYGRDHSLGIPYNHHHRDDGLWGKTNYNICNSAEVDLHNHQSPRVSLDCTHEQLRTSSSVNPAATATRTARAAAAISSPPSLPDSTMKTGQGFACEKCGKIFNARHRLKRHEMTHTNFRPYR